MSENFFINYSAQETRVAVVEQGKVSKFYIERALSKGLTGNIFLGKVIRILPDIQSAFIDIGEEKAGFLNIIDIKESKINGSNHLLSIEKLVTVNQEIIVQVIKDPIGKKGARLSTQISLAGRYLVFLPQNLYFISISQKIENNIKRERILLMLKNILPKNKYGGFIARTISEDASKNEILRDLSYLTNIWNNIYKRSKTSNSPNQLHSDISLLQKILRDLAFEKTNKIYVDSEKVFLDLKNFAQKFIPNISEKINLYVDDKPLFDFYNIEDKICQILAKKVNLKSGGNIIIEETESMITIDVNTGSLVSGNSHEDIILKTNLEAAEEITRQVRLRNLGGIIIIDFVDMEDINNQISVLNELKKKFLYDKNKVNISEFSIFGLVELTRKRTTESISSLLTEECKQCHGSGYVKTVRTITYEIMKEILKQSKKYNNTEFRILASKKVINLLLEEESKHLTILEKQIKKPIYLQVDNSYDHDQYNIIIL